jgi:hypothetical protein
LSLVATIARGISGSAERRTMAVACGAHALHDGFTDLLYVLLPLWQADFGLGYAEVGRRRPRVERPASDRRQPRRPHLHRAALAHRARQLQFFRRYRQDGGAGRYRLARRGDAVALGDHAVGHGGAGRRDGDSSGAARPAERDQGCGASGRGDPACLFIGSGGRFSAAAVDRHHRQCDADGVSDFSAVSAARERRRSAAGRRRLDPDLRRRCRGQARLRLSRGTARGGAPCS